MESRFFKTDQGKLHIKIPNEFNLELPTVLFLHGASPKSQNTEFWNPILDLILDLCNPILLDRFGHGQSESNEGTKIGIREQISSIIQLIDHILQNHNIDDLMIIGRSQGGEYASRLAKQVPDKISALGLIAPGGMKTNHKNLRDWHKPVSILWDINDPIVKFENYVLLKETLGEHHLFTIGETQEKSISIKRGEIKKSHAPEILAPSLFSKFLQSLVN